MAPTPAVTPTPAALTSAALAPTASPAPTPTPAAACGGPLENQLEVDSSYAGDWGGECTCPDGQVYLVSHTGLHEPTKPPPNPNPNPTLTPTPTPTLNRDP